MASNLVMLGEDSKMHQQRPVLMDKGEKATFLGSVLDPAMKSGRETSRYCWLIEISFASPEELRYI